MTSDRILSILCQDHSGVVNRITALFFSRNINIHKLSVCETEDDAVREIFIEVPYDKEQANYIVKLLAKIIDIIDVNDITDQVQFGQQHCMVRVKTDINTFSLGFNDLHAHFLGIRGDWIYLSMLDSVENISKTIDKLKEIGEVIFVRSGRLFLQ